jgi:hypothetical protein
MKASVDSDFETGFPIISFAILLGILGFLASIYSKINQKVAGNTKGSKTHMY